MEADIDPELRERLAEVAQGAPKSLRIRIGVGAAIVIVIAALVVSVFVSILVPRSTTDSFSAGSAVGVPTATPTDGLIVSSTDKSRPAIFVHVLGAVKHPGLFELTDGARVVDAVAAAGGFAPDGDPSGVNLARVLADGEQLAVPRVGEVAPVAPLAQAGGGGTTGAPGSKVNLNTATLDELEGLPHVGVAIAQRILDWRKANGRFASADDLMSVSGIGQKTFDDVKDLITV